MTLVVVACLSPNPQETEAQAAYLDKALPLINLFGGKILQRYGVQQEIVGERPSDIIMIVEYPDMASLQLVFNSETYQSIIPFRDKAFAKYSVSVIVRDD